MQKILTTCFLCLTLLSFNVFGQRKTENTIQYVRVAMGTGTSLNGFTTGNATIDNYIVVSSRRYAVDPLLIFVQMHQESAFKLRARSYKGASGLMQLMPATAVRFGVTDIYNPQQNIDAGVKYMRWLLNKFGGDVKLALAGYNAGEGAVMKYGYQIPPYRETQEYVRRILGRYASISNPNIIRLNNSTIQNNNLNVAKTSDNPQEKTTENKKPEVTRVQIKESNQKIRTESLTFW